MLFDTLNACLKHKKTKHHENDIFLKYYKLLVWLGHGKYVFKSVYMFIKNFLLWKKKVSLFLLSGVAVVVLL